MEALERGESGFSFPLFLDSRTRDDEESRVNNVAFSKLDRQQQRGRRLVRAGANPKFYMMQLA